MAQEQLMVEILGHTAHREEVEGDREERRETQGVDWVVDYVQVMPPPTLSGYAHRRSKTQLNSVRRTYVATHTATSSS